MEFCNVKSMNVDDDRSSDSYRKINTDGLFLNTVNKSFSIIVLA